MKTSVCITTLNEEKSVGSLIESLLIQTKSPDEIVFVDGGSSDKTIEIIKHFQRKDGRIKLFVDKLSASQGRNFCVELAKNDVIAMTDSGCIASPKWLKRITSPLTLPEIDISAGFYKMTTTSDKEKALSYFLGITPMRFDIHFLPSGRSIAFKKSAWEKIGGFRDTQEGTGEDTLFNYHAIKNHLKIARVKNAIVEWGTPRNTKEAFIKFFRYARGDAQSKIFLSFKYPPASHNIKASLIVLRYLAGLILLLYTFNNPPLFVLLILGIFLYFYLSFRKVFLEFGKLGVGLWGVYWQLISDFGVMTGFFRGLLDIIRK